MINPQDSSYTVQIIKQMKSHLSSKSRPTSAKRDGNRLVLLLTLLSLIGSTVIHQASSYHVSIVSPTNIWQSNFGQGKWKKPITHSSWAYQNQESESSMHHFSDSIPAEPMKQKWSSTPNDNQQKQAIVFSVTLYQGGEFGHSWSSIPKQAGHTRSVCIWRISVIH